MCTHEAKVWKSKEGKERFPAAEEGPMRSKLSFDIVAWPWNWCLAMEKNNDGVRPV